MPNTKTLIIAAVVAIISAVALVNILPSSDQEDDPITREKVSGSLKGALANATPKTDSATIASQWQWQNSDDQLGSNTGDDVQTLFTPQSVHDALQAVKVDENGDVVLDDDALISLDEALERIYNQLDGDSLRRLQDLIEEALPGKVGAQTAKLVEDYNGFLKAKDQFSQMYEGSAPPFAEQTVASIESDQALYGELQALREVHLGRDVADSLFKVSDANATFMFESMKLELDTSLTPEQRSQRIQEIQSRYEAITGVVQGE